MQPRSIILLLVLGVAQAALLILTARQTTPESDAADQPEAGDEIAGVVEIAPLKTYAALSQADDGTPYIPAPPTPKTSTSTHSKA